MAFFTSIALLEDAIEIRIYVNTLPKLKAKTTFEADFKSFEFGTNSGAKNGIQDSTHAVEP